MEENEVELSLGLSIGGSFRKFDKPAKDTASLPESKSDITSLSNSGDNHYDSEQKKCEIHALRRQEAKRKREVKKKRGRIVVGSVDNNHNNNNNNDNNTNESDGGSEAVMKKRLWINQEEIAGGIQMPVLSSAPAPAAFPAQFGQFSNVQFFNFGNGFAFPYHMVPFWAAAPAPATPTGEEKSENNVYYPVACRPLQGFLVERGNGGGVKSGESSGAAASSSSAVSESRNGMSSSSSRETSHSVESKSNQQQLQNSLKSNAEAQTEHSDSSHCATECAAQVIEEEQNTHKNKIISPKTTTATTNKSIDSIQRKAEEKESNSIHKPSPPPPPSNLPLMKKCNGGGDSNKPPKPQSKSPPLPRVQLPLLRSQSLPQMPCVSTTGDGPNGKKINGFLYKYSKTEVSIMCVCHGRSFTPAEFVEHAGRTDVSHPLKHIVVVPSAFR